MGSPLIRRGLVLFCLLWLGVAQAQEAPAEPTPVSEPPVEDLPAEPAPDPDSEDADPLSPYRLSLDSLTERAIGTASVPIEFNWRRTHVHLAANGGFLFELNNFDSARVGGLVRIPSKRNIVEIGLNYVGVWETPSSKIIALTPYRQSGRPSRAELDVGLVLPFAEGVVTTWPRFFPPVQMVFNAHVQMRYLFYPTSWGEMTPGEVGQAIFNPAMDSAQIQKLDDARLPGMAVDPGRYGLLVGFGNDFYLEQGVFVSPRVMLATPVLAPVSNTQLLFWADVSLAVGIAL